jgi:DNA repair exonuclease SbcCD ATPase subunit
MVINVISEKGLEVEVQLDDHRIVRNRSPNKLRVWKSKDHVWEDETEITRGTMSETQVLIDGLIGLTHQAFCNVVVFDDSNSYSFLESDTPTKRNIIENVLGLDRYREYNDIAKSTLRDKKNQIKDLIKDYEHLKLSLDECSIRIEKLKTQEKVWIGSKQKEVKAIIAEVKEKQKQLEESDHGTELLKYQKIQENIEELESNIDLRKPKKKKVEVLIKEAESKLELAKETKQGVNAKIQEHFLKIKEHEAACEQSSKLITSLERLDEGQNCPVCKGVIDKSNYKSVLSHEENILESSQDKIKIEQKTIEQEKRSFGKKSVFIEKLENNILEAKSKLNNLELKIEEDQKEFNKLSRIPKPDQNSYELILESEITQFKKQLKEKKEEYLNGSPYQEIIESAQQEEKDKTSQCLSKAQEIKDSEAILPYYEFWVEAFGDSGIRKFVVDGISSSIVFLDEITGGGIDKSGISGIYNMILELAKERQVIVTTHNENLSSMFEGCQEIVLKKVNDVTTLAS